MSTAAEMDPLTVAAQVRAALQVTVRSSQFSVSVAPMPAGDVTHFRVLLTFKLGAAPGMAVLRGLQIDICEWVAKRDPRATVDVWFHDVAGKLRPVAQPEPAIVSWPDTVQTIDD